MATVTGVTAARAQEIEDNSVVSGQLSGNDLILVTHDGTQINVGRVIPAPFNNWPVGSIFMNVDPTNPATLLGGGTWVRWGKGRVPVSVDENQSEFDLAEETGGAKTVQLQPNEMPYHGHGVTDPGHGHTYQMGFTDAGTHDWAFTYNTGTQREFSINSANSTDGNYTGISIQGAGGNAAHNNLQPYINVYMWKRTA